MPKRLRGELLDQEGERAVFGANHELDNPGSPHLSGTSTFTIDPDKIRASIEALTARINQYAPTALEADPKLLTMKEQLSTLVSTLEGL
ncbi:hypothetical protein KA119_00970 [Candidatus Gracilibacteria bacterium]|nr:hypothetical protein [Candidatus Gracilibacteria bacterium]